MRVAEMMEQDRRLVRRDISNTGLIGIECMHSGMKYLVVDSEHGQVVFIGPHEVLTDYSRRLHAEGEIDPPL